MRKFTLGLMAIGLSLTFHPLQSSAATLLASAPVAAKKVAAKPAEAAEAKALLLRLDEINKMDKTNLNSSDKKNLRMEVKSIQSRLGDLNGGVYLSVGAIIIIILLLILLL